MTSLHFFHKNTKDYMLSALQNEYVTADILKINYLHRKAVTNGFKF